MNIEFNYEESITTSELMSKNNDVLNSHLKLAKDGLYKKHLGFLDVDKYNNIEYLNKIKNMAEDVKNNSQVFLVIGVGGSNLGAKACIEALNYDFCNCFKYNQDKPQIIYLGDNLSSTYVNEVIRIIKDKDISVNVISKSGNTLEPAIVFRIIMDLMVSKYTEKELEKRIIITTDKVEGKLRKIANAINCQTLEIPSNVGGRFSVITSVGLLPIAVSGLNIENIIKGAKSGVLEYSNVDLNQNKAYQYAVARNILHVDKKYNKSIEMLVNYEPSLSTFGEWWKQLFGESEGKEGKGLFPATANFTTDLHSMGQYIQEGPRNMFVTTLNIDSNIDDITIKSTKDNLDDLNYLSGKTLNYINKKAFEATKKAHLAGGVPNLTVTIPKLNEFYLGKLIYFFEISCAMSGLLLNVNPFDQPGVEKYKDNLSELLNK